MEGGGEEEVEGREVKKERDYMWGSPQYGKGESVRGEQAGSKKIEGQIGEEFKRMKDREENKCNSRVIALHKAFS